MSDEFDVDLGGDVPAKRGPDVALTELAKERARRLEVAPDLEEYVAGEVAVTQSMIDRGVFKAEDDPEGRLQRTADYARWRWKGWLACEIESL